ncbi:MAG: histidine--tRNA ligase [Candidatus Pacearchaeota archaeon]|nr:histidine--tRNA ligase [Candidatus Pacearchaeota archaeon]
MIYEPETVKGFQDFLPEKARERAKIKEVIERYFKLYGFLPIETPTIEFDELMRTDATIEKEDEAVSDRFRLKDRGSRNLGLRYEFTFQLPRILKQNPNLKLPFKRYQIGSVFRDEPTSSNRFREFTQCDADIIGDSSIESDAECISLFSDILNELNIKPIIEINNRKLINSIIESVKIENKISVMRELDKLDKAGEDTIKANLRKYADANQIITLFKLLEKPLDFFVKNIFEGAEEIEKLRKLSQVYGFKIKFNPFMVRGFSYYTGNVFEIKIEGTKDSIAAGGRYDKTAGKYLNREIPAVGISFGLERLTNLAKVKTEKTKAILVSLNKNKESISLAKKLRKNNISCEISFGKPGKALEYANSLEIPYAIFIGEEEITKKKFKIKNMQSGEESLLTEKTIISKLKKS